MTPKSSGPMPISATVEIGATPDEVWRIVSDLGRMPEFSPELAKAFVIGKPGVGATVVGINRRKTRESGATWVYELEPTPGGTAVTGRRVLPRFTIATSLLGPFIGGAQGHDTELAEGIRATLERMRASIEAGGLPG